MRISLALYCSLIMFLLFFSLPSPVSSENQESTAQTTTTSWRRSLAQHGDSLRVFIRRRGGGGGGRGRSSRRPVPTGGGGGSSATTRPSLSITFERPAVGVTSSKRNHGRISEVSKARGVYGGGSLVRPTGKKNRAMSSMTKSASLAVLQVTAAILVHLFFH
ncbi:hypothetical protein HID58_000648 [Brassica napus]|uniref:Uncharacterized protein n=1 Tax=Brassica napus TaxID=3708 RepID=A0ABQ8EH46_BRANA|nr:hypothetical protein HID58_000648 [Brassica napus]